MDFKVKDKVLIIKDIEFNTAEEGETKWDTKISKGEIREICHIDDMGFWIQPLTAKGDLAEEPSIYIEHGFEDKYFEHVNKV